MTTLKVGSGRRLTLPEEWFQEGDTVEVVQLSMTKFELRKIAPTLVVVYLRVGAQSGRAIGAVMTEQGDFICYVTSTNRGYLKQDIERGDKPKLEMIRSKFGRSFKLAYLMKEDLNAKCLATYKRLLDNPQEN